jgi:hypothetical protein
MKYLLKVGSVWMCHGNMCYAWTLEKEKAAKLTEYEVKNYLTMFFFDRVKH